MTKASYCWTLLHHGSIACSASRAVTAKGIRSAFRFKKNTPAGLDDITRLFQGGEHKTSSPSRNPKLEAA